MRLLLAASLWLAGCSTDPAAPGGDDGGGGGDGGGGDDGPGKPPFEVTDPTDADSDGLPEQLEDHIMATFGPELRLAPDEIDWTRPSSVDWFLSKVKMRFDHPLCPDDGSNLLDVGAITFANVAQQDHATKSSGIGLCRHTDDHRQSSKKELGFFLQAEDDDLVHPGIPPSRSAEWRSYIQVRPSSYVRAGDGKHAAYDLQVWYFFPYNDFVASANHEADWEHLTLSISALDDDFAVVSAFFATHDDGDRFDDLTKLEWVDTHVVGYVADGSHATYATIGEHDAPVPGIKDHTYAGGPVWQTWTNAINLGQAGKILHDQTWAAYGGRWGEVGETSFTSGPPGPMFHGTWETASEYPK